ncbi:MAG TPA: histone deacetylase [Methylomirabilota bacterium]|jgi:acetoin utilization deacetylase AcuC-like enzyme|nr:histone deacetylase [Methylomirabilota bacterium]
MSDRVPLVWSAQYGCDIGAHVFPTEKFEATYRALVTSGDVDATADVSPPPVTRELLALAHEPAYLDDLDALRWTPRTMYSELPLTREIIAAFALGAAGTTLAARLALERGAAAHLGGGLHHAYAGHAEGFCYINDLAVAARAMLAERRVERIAIVDLDVHQGNGTAHIFRDEPAVFTLSLHQENNYPMPKEVGDLDIGLADGTGDDAYLAALAPALERVWAFAPRLVLYQAGADPYRDDQLGGLALSLAGLEARDRALLEGCARRGIAVATTLGGGYARRLDDTVHIHATTSRLALAIARGHVNKARG